IIEAKKAVLGGDFEYAGRMALLNKQIQDRALNEIFKASPDTVIGAGLSKLNDAFGAEYLTRRAGEIDAALDNLAKEATGRMVGGTDTEIIKRTVMSGNSPLAVAVIDESLAALTHENAPQAYISEAVEQ